MKGGEVDHDLSDCEFEELVQRIQAAPERLSTQDLSAIFGVEPVSVRRWFQKNRLPGNLLSRRVGWHAGQRDVLAFAHQRYGRPYQPAA